MKETENLNFSGVRLIFISLVKIQLLVFIRSNKNRSYTEKIKYPLYIAWACLRNADLGDGMHYITITSKLLALYYNYQVLKM